MSEEVLEVQARRARITIDYGRCEPAKKNSSNPSCGFACVKACRLYGRNVLRIEENRPALAVADPKEVERLDNECIACEYHCWLRGTSCVSVEIPLSGIDEYRANRNRGRHGCNH